MKRQQPQGMDRRQAERLLSQAQPEETGSRIDFFSRSFVGLPYKTNPLVGSVDTPEVFTASLDSFDCVTYIETVLALARAANVDQFAAILRKVRYEKGHVEWKLRNHYITDWIRNNACAGLIEAVSIRGVKMITRERVLNAVPGLAAKRTGIEYLPKRALPRIQANLKTGDLIFFVSTRNNLDVFHGGIVVRDTGLVMRHASRSQGGVVEDELGAFLKANRMAGIIVVRSQDKLRAGRKGKIHSSAPRAKFAKVKRRRRAAHRR